MTDALLEDHLAALDLGEPRVGHRVRQGPGPGQGHPAHQPGHGLGGQLQGGLPAKGHVREHHPGKGRAEHAQVEADPGQLDEQKGRPDEQRRGLAVLPESAQQGREVEPLPAAHSPEDEGAQAVDSAQQQPTGQPVEDRLLQPPAAQPAVREEEQLQEDEPHLGEHEHADVAGHVDRPGTGVEEKGGGQANTGEQAENERQHRAEGEQLTPGRTGQHRLCPALLAGMLQPAHGQPASRQHPRRDLGRAVQFRLDLGQVEDPVAPGRGLLVALVAPGLVSLEKIVQVEEIGDLPARLHDPGSAERTGSTPQGLQT